MNKYLITVIVPTIDYTFDIEVPNNRKIGTIKKILLSELSELSELSNGSYNLDFNDMRIVDRDSGTEYSNDMYIKDSKIVNGSKIVMI